MKKRRGMGEWWSGGVAGWLLVHALVAAPIVLAANLAPNGSFDDETDPLTHWQYKYERKGESHYFDNHNYVSIVPRDGNRRNVLRLHVATQYLADNPGVKVDSHPIAVKPGGRYRLSAWARSTGPDLRLYAVGYKWRPGVTPYPNPSIYDLRKCYNFSPLFFGPVKAGIAGGLSRGAPWAKATGLMPDADPKVLKELQQKLYNDVQFLVIHVIGIRGAAGEVFVDDIMLERLN